jgi:hypothetical protein
LLDTELTQTGKRMKKESPFMDGSKCAIFTERIDQ